MRKTNANISQANNTTKLETLVKIIAIVSAVIIALVQTAY